MNKKKERIISLILASGIFLNGCTNGVVNIIKNAKADTAIETISIVESIVDNNKITETIVPEEIEETLPKETTITEVEETTPTQEIQATEEITQETAPSEDNQQTVEKEMFDSQIVYCNEDTNLYANNNDNALVIGNIHINDSAYRILSESNGWDLIIYNNQIAYIKTSSLEFTEETIQTEYQYTPKTDIVLTTAILNFREGPSTEYKVIDLLNIDTELEVMAEVNNGWLLVKYNGILGYVSGSYTTSLLNKVNELYPEVNLTEIAPQKVVYTTTSLNFRMGPSTEYESMGTFEKYESLRVLCEFDDWYFVMTNEHTFGYVHKAYAKELEDIFIVVDKSEQKMFMYKDNELYYITSVTTGADATPSDTGLFRVWLMETDRYLTDGKTYNSHVDYAMFYNGGEAVHDADWRFMFYVEGKPERKKFGSELYHQYGSHGCINTPSDIMDDLYNLSEIGTKVLVHK